MQSDGDGLLTSIADGAPMIPMKTSSVFKSRWFALIWAAGILWFAYDVAGGGDTETDANGVTSVTDISGAKVGNEQMDDVKKAIDGI